MNMCIVVKILTVSLICTSIECRLEKRTTATFEQANSECLSLNMHLPRMSTTEEYEDMINFKGDSKYKTWLGLKWNPTLENYQWLNGYVMTNLKWGSGQANIPVTTDTCVSLNVGSKEWYKVTCTQTKHYICMSGNSYEVGTEAVGLYTAFGRCQASGKTLPLDRTTQDSNLLKTIINSETLTSDIWLGLLPYGDNFKWVTGEELSIDLPRKDNKPLGSIYEYIHYHHDGGLHADDKAEQEYYCQLLPPPVASVVKNYHPDKYTRQSNQAVVLGVFLKEFKVKGRTGCAAECTKDVNTCFIFTVSGSTCKTYGDIQYQSVQDSQTVLWKRKLIP